MTIRIIAFSITTLSIMAFHVTTLRITTLYIKIDKTQQIA
jgi:hypothetical protein